jgi:thiamine-monophosphate kinase
MAQSGSVPPVSAEDRLIARYFRPLATDPGAFGLCDDAAVLSVPAEADCVLKADAIICGVHFFPDDPPDLVARKALRVNLSDLAAKGAKPVGFLLSLALPADIGDQWLAPFASGLGADARAFACPLLGGDTDRTPGPVTISIAAIGTLPRGSMVRRSGASPGDRVFVTGTIGDAALGLALRQTSGAASRWGLDRNQQDHLAQRYLLPQPRNPIAEALRIHASAAMDISDGLAGDLGKLCAASDVSGEVEVARLPLSDAAACALAREPALIETIAAGGDDYEVACTIPPDRIASFLAAASAAGVPVCEIGRIVSGREPPRFINRDNSILALKRLSFSHF